MKLPRSPATILGFFDDRWTAQTALRRIKRRRFRRAAAVQFPERGGVFTRGFAFGVNERLLDRYRRWITAEETLIVVQAAPAQAGEVLALLREGATSDPATFVLPPQRAVPDTSPGGAEYRPERFTTEELKLHAARLAANQRVVAPKRSGPRGLPFWQDLSRCQRVIETATHGMADATRTGQYVSLAGQWLLDNAYVVRRQIADVRRNFSRGLYDVLPVLERGLHRGKPRIYELALEFVAHSEARVDTQELAEFLRAYQRREALTIGELWAMPLTLRLALLESLAHVAVAIERWQLDHERADFVANRLLNATRFDPDRLLVMLAVLAGEDPTPSPYFADRLLNQLEGEAFALDPVRAWLERKLGAPISASIQSEQVRQAADQVRITNVVSSLRLLGQADWREVFEQVSPVDEVLRQDPAAVYAVMDFGTRDAYRHAVEEIARHAGDTEVAVARASVRAAQEAGSESDDLRRHVGYFLIGAGRDQLEARTGAHAPLRAKVRRWTARRPARVYAGGIVLVTTALVAALSVVAAAATNAQPELGGAGRIALLALLAALVVTPASEVAAQLVNLVITRLLPPRVLPKFSFSGGIPDEWRTLVVVPMLFWREDIAQELERLELRFLGNRDPNLHFALLADFTDASHPNMPGDDELLATAVSGIEELNRRYGSDQFALLYRQRLWSESEQVWMGWERKRGKLEELNRLLVALSTPDGDDNQPASQTSTTIERPSTLAVLGGGLDALRDTRFVITLDSDTQLPHNSARRMVETLAHPLNRPRLAPDGRTVAWGYGIIQPRISTSLPSAMATRFSRVFTDPVGADPYSRVVSDVYQDLAGEGSYHGKGIYDVRVFNAVLDSRFPDALLLSHDLLEGAHVRVGLATDIELFDEFPRSYSAYATREHRWIRGDWQIAQWCTPWVPHADNGSTRNPLSPINRWKIFDNLRRSLVAPAAVALLASGWLLLPGFAWPCTALIALLLWLPPTLRLSAWLVNQPAAALTPWRGAQGWKEQRTGWMRSAFEAAFLAHRALIALDAVSRVFYRRAVSRRRLLQWQTSAKAGGLTGADDAGPSRGRRVVWQVGAVALFAAALGAALAAVGTDSVAAALPFLLLWLLPPMGIAWLNGRRPGRADRPLPAADRTLLRRLARRTWRYFDDLIGAQTNWLPPDNYQTALRVEVAQRTSPTNIGLWLLATLAAHDFGYLTLDQMIERSSATIETLRRLERSHGHMFNWYHIGSLEPLSPRYISTVDSGNLRASLWAFNQGCAQQLAEPVLGPAALHGLRDALALLQDAPLSERPAGALAVQMTQLVGRLTTIAGAPAVEASDIVAQLRTAAGPADELVNLLGAGQAAYWAAQIQRQIAAHLDMADRYLAWVEPGRRAPSLRALATDSVYEPEAPAVSRARWLAGEVVARAEEMMAHVESLANEMNMRFLYNQERKLFSVGYNVDDRRLDPSHYDLLASEARLGSLVAIAAGDVPVDHWLALGRPFGRAAGHSVLLSWAGTMFEYLMPLLLTRTYENSLLDQACRAAVAVQIDNGARRGVPWGISEAAYSAVDAHRIYQYQPFGVPELGLKRGLADDLVVAPYATVLALAIDPRQAMRNLRALARAGLDGEYGNYESIDFTPRRAGAAGSGVVVHAYMANHQGMTLLALDNALHQNVMPARFHADPRIRASESLLFERIPLAPPLADGMTREAGIARLPRVAVAEPGSRFIGPDSATPQVQLLANQNYAVMVTSAGGGYSRWHDFDVARWRADTTCDGWGTFIYLRDLDDGTVWSAAHHPVRRPVTRYTALFSPARVEFERRDVGIATRTEIAVSSEDDAEVRRVTLANMSGRVRHVEVTSYVELALAAHGADRAHPAFSKMFVDTEALPAATGATRALLAWRKPRSPSEPSIWATHVLALPPQSDSATQAVREVQYETDRARFIGRGRSVQHPRALQRDLSNSTGHVLDPIFSLRCRVTLAPGQRFQLAFVTAAATDRQGVLALAQKYGDLGSVERALELSWSLAQLLPRQLRVSVDDLRRFQRLASHMLFPSGALRGPEQHLRQNRHGQARLWAHGISGDLPIMLVQIGDAADLDLVREALTAHACWGMEGLKADLVILDEEAGGYEQPLREALNRLVQAHGHITGVDSPGGIFVRRAEQVASEDVALLLAVASVVLVASRGRLAEQLATLAARANPPAPLRLGRRAPEEPSAPLAFMELPYFNGYGGFTPDGREYAIYLGPETHTPAPWSNVMANPRFGALVSEAGQGFVWSDSSQSNRLTPWSNDPVVDPSGDAIYIRDEESGVFWTPTALPVRELDAYRARHGQGYTVFEHNSHAIEQELLVCVPVDANGGAPVRLQRLRLRNGSSRRRRLSITAFAEWVLGASREETQMHVVTTWDADTHALFAYNHYRPDLGGRVAFASASLPVRSFTADRTEFLGRNGHAARPAAMLAQGLSGRTGVGLDPCAALQVIVEIDPGQQAEVVFTLGQAADVAQARALVRAFRDPARVDAALDATHAEWDRLLGTVQVETPDMAVNFLLNRWLLYQTLSCRVWGRSAFYQSGGAFGFRDQLQDAMALVYAAPDLVRTLILTAAARQFTEGDVQHWWHPHSGAGIRSRCSDDLLWLPFVTAHYVRVTGDASVLNERAPFLEGRRLERDEHEAYFVPTTSPEHGTLLEHCRRAIAKSLTAGPHGLPLMGTGDWNDGMNLVGAGGVGESVWLAWFQIDVLNRFADLVEQHTHAVEVSAMEVRSRTPAEETAADEARYYRERATQLAAAVERSAWDGEWYLRAFFDDGSPLGSKQSREAQIDSLPQSWAVLCGAADPARARQALASADAHLVRDADDLVLLFTPPFEGRSRDPGYIKAYPPGVRENGGQYTHGAIWYAMAHARLGNGDKAVRLLRMLSPVEHARTPEAAQRYRVEPYVVAADVYALEGKVGQGGWTWYTGSSGWMYRAWLEEVLGFQRRGDRLELAPVLPAAWDSCSIWYRHRGREHETLYAITIENPDHVGHGIAWLEVDGQRLAERDLALLDDGGEHRVIVRLG